MNFMYYPLLQITSLESHKSKLEDELQNANSTVSDTEERLTQFTSNLNQKEEQIQNLMVRFYFFG